MKRILLPFLSLFLISAFAQKSDLGIGDAAPELKVSKWLKGDSIDGIEKGKVHVLESWASWCGPCIAAIPHVTELQKKHPDVIFIGMNVWERQTSKAVSMVKKMGDKMDYRVALDDDDHMADNWMKASGQSGIPCSFIIDKDGKVAWIGHPMSMDPVLEKVIDGTFDADEFAKMQEKSEKIQRVLMGALRDEDWDEAVKQIDNMLAIKPPNETRLLVFKFQTLLGKKKDADAAYKLAADFPKRFKDDANTLNEIAWFIVDEPDLPRRDLDLAFKMATRGVELTKRKDGAILDTLARVHWEKGESSKAIKLQTEAVSVADERMVEDLKETLRNYKKKNTL